MNAPKTSAYSLSVYEEGDCEIVLYVRPIGLTIEQFDDDAPRLIARIRCEIIATQEDRKARAK